MIKIYNNDIHNIINDFINDESFKRCDLIILDLNNFIYTNNYTEDLNKIKEILYMSSYIIKPGGNIVVIGNNIINIKDIDIDEVLKNELLWKKRRTIIHKCKLIPGKLLSSEYNYIFWYSDNYRPDDPVPTCHKYGDNKKELSDFWNEDVDIYKNIIKMFSNENDTVFEPITNSDDISKYCEELNRNYIGFKNLLV